MTSWKDCDTESCKGKFFPNLHNRNFLQCCNILDENINNSNECVAENGEPCIFPFNYHDKTFEKCTHYDANDGKVWCAVAVNSGGDMTSWKNCDKEACKGENI